MRDHKRDGLGFRLAHRFGGGGPALGLVQHLVREFMTKVLNSSAAACPGSRGDAAAVAHPQRGRDALFELKLDALGEGEVDQPLPVLADAALDPRGQFGELGTLGLRDIEDISRTETLPVPAGSAG